MKKLLLPLFALTAMLAVSCSSEGPDKKEAGAPKKIKGIETVYIPAGTFLMGSPGNEPERNSDELQHSVTLTKGFYMSKYEITNAQYWEFLNDIKSSLIFDNYSSYYKIYLEIPNVGKVEIAETDSAKKGLQYYESEEKSYFYTNEGYGDHPMKYVTWYGADEYAKWIGGALPTEAQWEYACRGGQKESLPFGIGDGTKLIKDMANFDTHYPYDLEDGVYFDDSGNYGDIVAVGSYSPNAWGLYDMHGNVYEWCSDWYEKDYYSDNQTDPLGPESGENHVYRGGCFISYSNYCRSASRNIKTPNYCGNTLGFRVVFAK